MVCGQMAGVDGRDLAGFVRETTQRHLLERLLPTEKQSQNGWPTVTVPILWVSGTKRDLGSQLSKHWPDNRAEP